jgi:hypothetical protein
MRSIVKLVAVLAIFAAFASAETWNGRLLDASCVEAQKSAACDPTASTVAFAINVSGKIYRFDDAGNAKAVEALKTRTERSKDPNQPPSQANAAISAKVTGMLEGEVVKVESIQVQ